MRAASIGSPYLLTASWFGETRDDFTYCIGVVIVRSHKRSDDDHATYFCIRRKFEGLVKYPSGRKSSSIAQGAYDKLTDASKEGRQQNRPPAHPKFSRRGCGTVAQVRTHLWVLPFLSPQRPGMPTELGETCLQNYKERWFPRLDRTEKLKRCERHDSSRR